MVATAPGRTPRVAPLGGLAQGALAVAPLFALELVRAHASAGSWAVAACLAVLVGGGLALGVARVESRVLLGLVLLAAAPLLAHESLLWALRRAAVLRPELQVAWDVALLVGSALAGARYLPRPAALTRRAAGALLAASAGPIVLLGAQSLWPDAWPGFSSWLLWLAGIVTLLALVRRPRLAVLWLVAALGFALAIERVDPLYRVLREVIAALAIGAAIVGARELASGRPSRLFGSVGASAPGGGRLRGWWPALGCWLLCALCGEQILRHGAGAPAAPAGTGLYSAVLGRIQRLADLDGDGHGVLFGHHDCAPFDARVHPGAHEVAANGRDDNCLAGDARLERLPELAALQANAARPPVWSGDVVLVVIDTLRHDEAQAKTLSTLRAIETRALRFERAYATASFTVQSMLGLLTGRLAPCVDYVWRSPNDAIPTRVPETLLEQLARAGFDVGMVGGVGPAFDRNLFGRGVRVSRWQTMDASAQATTDQALQAWAELDAGKRRFMYVHYMEVHDSHGDLGVYRRKVAAVDAAFAPLWRELGERALFVVTADHGESFGLHGRPGHSTQLYDEVMHVPLYFAMPGGPTGPITQLTSLLQVAPTLRAMVGEPGIGPGPGPYLCVGQQPCRDALAPMALERRAVHLHGLVQGSRQLLRDLTLQRDTAYALDVDPLQRTPLVQVPAGLGDALTLWEELGMQEAPGNHWPGLRVTPTP